MARKAYDDFDLHGNEGNVRAAMAGALATLASAKNEDGTDYTLPVDTELTTADLNTGGGTDNRAVVGLVSAENGGGTLVGSANPLPVVGTFTADPGISQADLDTGGGTDTQSASGIMLAENGGAVLVGSANPLPVSGPLTDVELRADPVPVSGPLTDAELRDSAVPVSGPLTDAELRDSPVDVASAVADGDNVALGAIGDAAWTTGNGTVIALLKAIHGELVTMKGVLDTIATNTTPA